MPVVWPFCYAVPLISFIHLSFICDALSSDLATFGSVYYFADIKDF